MNFDDIDIKKLTLNEGDVLLVRVPRGNVPMHTWNEYAVNLRDALQIYFLTNRIIVADADINITIIEQGKQNEL